MLYSSMQMAISIMKSLEIKDSFSLLLGGEIRIVSSMLLTMTNISLYIHPIFQIIVGLFREQSILKGR